MHSLYTCKPHVALSRFCVLLSLFAACLAAILAAFRRSRKLLETYQRRCTHACGCALRVGARLTGPGALPLQGSAQICNGGCSVGESGGVVNGRFCESKVPCGQPAVPSFHKRVAPIDDWARRFSVCREAVASEKTAYSALRRLTGIADGGFVDAGVLRLIGFIFQYDGKHRVKYTKASKPGLVAAFTPFSSLEPLTTYISPMRSLEPLKKEKAWWSLEHKTTPAPKSSHTYTLFPPVQQQRRAPSPLRSSQTTRS